MSGDMRLRPAPKRRQAHGLALVAVLWFVVALSVLVLALAQTARYNSQWVFHDLERARTTALLDGALAVAAARADYFGDFSRAGRLAVELAGGQRVEIVLRPASGFIDINQASPELLEQMFLATGADAAQAGTLAAAVVQQRRRASPQVADSDAGVPTGPFRVPEDLMWVPGVGRDRYAQLASIVIAEGGLATVNPFAATERTQRIIAGEEFERLREGVSRALAALPGDVDSLAVVPALPADIPAAQFLNVSGSPIVRLEAALVRGERRWRREQWIDTATPSRNGLPWRVIRTSAVYSEPNTEASGEPPAAPPPSR